MVDSGASIRSGHQTPEVLQVRGVWGSGFRVQGWEGGVMGKLLHGRRTRNQDASSATEGADAVLEGNLFCWF